MGVYVFLWQHRICTLTWRAQYEYIYREVVRDRIPIKFFEIEDGQEMSFGGGHSPMPIDLPDPGFCNLKLAVARVVHASGAAEALNAFERDYDDFLGLQGVHLGSDDVSDDLIFEHLFIRTNGLQTITA
jgi:hypothetical protein